MRSVIPHLWFDKEAEEAASFYVSVFPQSQLLFSTQLHNTPSGDCKVVGFNLWGKEFMAISAGPYFRFNPSISFIVNFDPVFFDEATDEAIAALDSIWNQLLAGGTALMPLGEYPFSKRYGWVQDRYGLSWQLMLTNPEGDPRPPVIPSLLFTGEQYCKAAAAADKYTTVFKDSERGAKRLYNKGMEPEKEGAVMFSDFRLGDTWFAAMDSVYEHKFAFNEAVSFLVSCDDQEEIDHFWEKLSAVPEAEQCGWLKDEFGISWQITSRVLQEMLRSGSQEKIDGLTQLFLKMKKIDIATLLQAS